MDKRVLSYGVVTPEALKSYDGLGFLKAIIDGTVPNPPISELMGFHLTEVAEGRAVFEGLPGIPPLQSNRHRPRRVRRDIA